MLVLYTFLFLVALVCFGVSAFSNRVHRVDLVAAGLFACTLVWFLQMVQRH